MIRPLAHARVRTSVAAAALASVLATHADPSLATPHHARAAATSKDPAERRAFARKAAFGITERTHHRLPPSLVGRDIPNNVLVRSTLEAVDFRLPSGESAEAFVVRAQAGSLLDVRLHSGAFDPYLVVISSGGRLVENDDADGALDSHISLPVPSDETFYIVATSYRAGALGAYDLRITARAPSAQPVPAPTVVVPGNQYAGNARPPMVMGTRPTASPAAGGESTLRGALATGDPARPNGALGDLFTLQLVAGQPVRLEARSTDFDTVLVARSPSGREVVNDDGEPGSTDSILSFTPAESGTWQLVLTSYRPGETGDYELRAEGSALSAASGPLPTVATAPDPGGRPAPGPAPTPGRPPEVSPVTPPAARPGEMTRGSLQNGDQRLSSGEFMDSLQFQLAAGESVRFHLASSEFDPYLIVRPPSGRQVDNDDFQPGSRDAEVTVRAQQAGTYTVVVTSYQAGEHGAYQLAVERGASVAQTTPSSAPSGPGGSNAHVWGVFAGITDYPGGINDLPECANDARKLVQSLQRRGLLAQDHYALLTDREATTSAIRSAMQQFSGRMGADDVFLFFFSGHGSRGPEGSHDPNEIDGRDESIVLYDGSMLDDEMARLFDGVHTRIGMLALDSCFAGGFAKDVISRPGRIGLFSSEEDVPSSVAENFQAGGYLSHFLQTGVEGDADNDPQDGTLTVGELSHYVWRQFGTRGNDLSQGDMGYQHLVVDRGAVRAPTELWQYAR